MKKTTPPNVVRIGHGANCSSIGSAVDVLFASSVVATAILAAVMSSLEREAVELAGEPIDERDPRTDEESS